MKPSFALNLTDDGVTLLHRTARGWLDVGFVAFTDPDMAAALDYLRSTALGLSPKGMTTKLVIPNAQILYTEVDLNGVDEAGHSAHIASALDGKTPYDVADLVFDWEIDGKIAHVAVVPRETLAEAEAFAAEHRFNPLSFVAIPDPTGDVAFDGEPFFGPSSLAPSLLPKNQTLQRDSDAISIITREMPKDSAKTPEPEPEVAPEPEVVTEPEFVAEPEVVAEPKVVAEPEAVDQGAPTQEETPEDQLIQEADVESRQSEEFERLAEADPEPEPERAPVSPVTKADPDPAPDAGQNLALDRELDLEVERAFAPEPKPTAEKAATIAAETKPFVAPIAQPPAAVPKAGPQEVEEAPMAIDVDQDDFIAEPEEPEVAPAGATAPDGAEDDLPPALSSAAMLAFASRRGADVPGAARGAGVADAGLQGGDAANSAPPLRPIIAPGAKDPLGPNGARPIVKPLVERPAAARPAPKFSYDDPVPPPPRMPGDPPSLQGSVMGKAGKGLRSIGALVSAPSVAGKSNKKAAAGAAAVPASSDLTVDALSNVATLRPPAKATTLSRPTQPLVKPDALAKGLSARAAPQRGKPRFLGLILTGVLLLILALVAAWSSYYLTQRNQADPVAVASGEAAASDPEMVADLQDEAAPAADEAAVSATDAEQAADIATPGAVVPDLPVAEEVPAQAAVIEPAPQTGVDTEAAAVAPLEGASQDEIFLAGNDTPPALSDPLLLTAPAAAADALPSAQQPPPPFGTVYKFDANGLIEPMPGGILTPEGVNLIAGKPPRVPPQRPAKVEAAALAAAPAPAAAAAPAADVVLLPEQTFAADPTLSAARPRLRPETLAPDAAAPGSADDASLAPADGSRVASLRPRLRPAAILAAGEAARLASQSASLAANAAAEAAIVQASASISPQAVSVSRVPAPRPRSLTRAVEAAVAAATRQPDARRAAAAEPAPEPAPKAKTHDEADDEPEVATAAPRIPTRANVAKQATFVNAINLSKTNLIGVYGSPSRRYALIRQSNGRYKKVNVGDSIEGGRIQAITATEVRYQKGGRLIALAMPKG